MKCVIFCGGRGVRLGEKTNEIPKPLLEVGGRPIVEHIMNHYSKHGVDKFVLCLGYLGNEIRDKFSEKREAYKINLVDTGENATRAERLIKIREHVGDTFFASYGDDLCNVDITSLLKFHEKEGKIATLTAVRLPSAYGTLELDEFQPHLVSNFREKPILKEWINGGYFVFCKKIFDYIKEGDELENEVFCRLVKNRELAAYRHCGIWKSMNTLKDHVELNEMYDRGELESIVKWRKDGQQFLDG